MERRENAVLYVCRKPYGVKLFLNNYKSNTYFKFKKSHHFGYIERIKKKVIGCLLRDWLIYMKWLEEYNFCGLDSLLKSTIGNVFVVLDSFLLFKSHFLGRCEAVRWGWVGW